MTSPAFTRRTLLLGTAGLVGAAGLGLAGCTSVPSIPRVTTSPTGPIRQQLQSVMDTIAAGNPRLGMAVKDFTSGGIFNFRGSYESQSASAAKPMIVLMALRKARSDGGPLPAAQSEQGVKAIKNSDNDSADALWKWAGGRPAYDALAKDLGLAKTHSDPARDFWSWTWTTPLDQLALVQAIAKGSKAIDDADREYLLDLMGQVQDDQSWGVGQPRSGAVKTWLKNGWVQFQSTDKLWAVNSIGQVTGEGRDYLLTVMNRAESFEIGREYCNEIGKWVFHVLGSGKLT